MLKLPVMEAFEFYKTFLEWYCTQYHPSYLEVGCNDGGLTCRLADKCTRSVALDIAKHPQWEIYRKKYPTVEFIHQSSNEFFAEYDEQFDLIFIDGDHSYEQVLTDVENSLGHLNEDGLICLHDTLPPTKRHASSRLCGTAYKAARLLRKRDDLEVYTFPVTFGLTLVGRIGSEFPW